ncbi:hypothetical protein [Bacillus cereus]|uniref:hypothetical protein n=1 Tax=Bacillus cereus TaxID=1396 RepID=UPI001596CC6B|nr:hypothetical protein [Bacillus cereus]
MSCIVVGKSMIFLLSYKKVRYIIVLLRDIFMYFSIWGNDGFYLSFAIVKTQQNNRQEG